eukprot:TRINITY_DN32202_c0_g1_i1.p1 TRINITY_DN32202_c0_g1~~TRINITY_DN32202_c0_g1_i1.p1  ORF type:complete len:224 (+),score=89.87 TRINITY_DN32202_c0_g1_i1:52-723(+)
MASRAVLRQARRGIHSVYGGFKNQGSGAVSSMTSWTSCRGSVNTHYREAPGLEGYSSSGKQLASAVQHDIDRLLASDWTTDYSGFWEDQVALHANTFTNLYDGGVHTLIAPLTELSNYKPEEKTAIKLKLDYLKAAHKWAERTQEIYSAIFDLRTEMQVHVWDAIEREKILAQCTEACENFAKEVPSEFRRKATKDLEWHLWNLRHWVWDAPNVKRAFPVTMA